MPVSDEDEISKNAANVFSQELENVAANLSVFGGKVVRKGSDGRVASGSYSHSNTLETQTV